MTQPWVLFDQVSIIRGERSLLQGLSFSLSKGDVTFIRGANGSGKSTTLQLCLQILTPTAGNIILDSKVARAYLAHHNGLYGELTVTQNLDFFARMLKQKYLGEMTKHLLDQLGLCSLKHVPLRHLSCGQKRKVALVRLLLHPAKLWVLDEPVSNLDDSTTEWFTQHLIHHQENGGAALIACHAPLKVRHAREVYLDLN